MHHHSELVRALFWTEAHLITLDLSFFLCFQTKSRGGSHYEGAKRSAICLPSCPSSLPPPLPHLPLTSIPSSLCMHPSVSLNPLLPSCLSSMLSIPEFLVIEPASELFCRGCRALCPIISSLATKQIRGEGCLATDWPMVCELTGESLLSQPPCHTLTLPHNTRASEQI